MSQTQAKIILATATKMSDSNFLTLLVIVTETLTNAILDSTQSCGEKLEGTFLNGADYSCESFDQRYI